RRSVRRQDVVDALDRRRQSIIHETAAQCLVAIAGSFTLMHLIGVQKEEEAVAAVSFDPFGGAREALLRISSAPRDGKPVDRMRHNDWLRGGRVQQLAVLVEASRTS